MASSAGDMTSPPNGIPRLKTCVYSLKPENLRQAAEEAEASGSPDTANTRESLKGEEGETREAARAGDPYPSSDLVMEEEKMIKNSLVGGHTNEGKKV